MLGACLLLGSGRLYGQREIIATAETVTTSPAAGAPGATPRTIQSTAYVPDAPQPPPSPMLSPSALLNGMTRTGGTPVPSAATGGMSVPPLPGGKPFQPPTGGAPVPSTAVGGMLGQPAVLSVDVVGPDRILLGQPLAHEIVVRNVGGQPIAELHVEEPVPVDARVRKADPPAVKHDNRLVWDLPYLEAGGERRLKVELELGRPGELNLRPYVSVLMGNGLRAQVVRPPFSIEMSADRTQATRGESVRFRIQLANNVEEPIRNIKIYDALPSGLHHPSGPIISVQHFGDLLPGQTKGLPLETTAVESGTFHHEILAQADRGVEAKAAVDVVISEPNLSLRIEGPDKTVTQREVDFHLEAANPAGLTAKDVRLVQTLPPAFEVVSASTGASFDSNHHALVWSLTDLGAGQRHRVTFRVRVNDGGDWPMTAAVQSQNFPEARVNHTLQAQATASLKLEVHAREDRLSVGEETVIRIRVFNKGGAPCGGVRLAAVLPESVVPFKAEGPSSEQIEKQQVHFAPLARLEAHGDVAYYVHVRGQQAGKGSLRVQLTAENQVSAEKEISIQVNEAGTIKSVSGETLR
jgi:uncharacterized repeat protein (TIGR01451 family)